MGLVCWLNDNLLFICFKYIRELLKIDLFHFFEKWRRHVLPYYLQFWISKIYIIFTLQRYISLFTVFNFKDIYHNLYLILSWWQWWLLFLKILINCFFFSCEMCLKIPHYTGYYYKLHLLFLSVVQKYYLKEQNIFGMLL